MRRRHAFKEANTSTTFVRRALGGLTGALLPPYRAKRPPSRKVAIVVPLSARSGLLPEEAVSMRHLRQFLGAYDKYLVAPRGTDARHDGFTTVFFDRKFFGSAAAHNPLLFWDSFYATFADYEFILIYHLDCLVFSDQVMRWCEAGYDYIGAPWIPGPDAPWITQPSVGNGGFALMKTHTALAALRERHRRDPTTYWADLLLRNERRLRPLRRALEKVSGVMPGLRLVEWPLRQWQMGSNPGFFGCNNDYFWSFAASRYLPSFRVAPVREGLRFAFETSPRRCFELNGGQLPFGCHAWPKYDREFWAPYLLPAADTLSVHHHP
jgi:hypothetical protein